MTSQSNDTSSSENEDVRAIKTVLESNPSVNFIRCQWVDFTATIRTRLITVRQALRLASQGQSISVANPLVSAFLVDGSFNEIAPGAHDSLVLDWKTITVCHYHPTNAAVMCCIDEGGNGFDACPRSLLSKVERKIEEQHGITFQVGVEVEFYLTESPDSTSAVKDIVPYSATASLRTPYRAVLEDAVQAIERAGIPVWTFHPELVAGLFEISLESLPPLQAADALVYVHETIRATAVSHGLHATMHPKPFDKTHSVGQHMHISLSRDTYADCFLAGVLESVPGLMAISMPSYDSYLRTDFIGGGWISWDDENRLSTIRRVDTAHWEFRFVDGTANNYLTLALLLGVGAAAIGRQQELRMKPLKGQMPLSQDIRQELGIEKPVPRGLKDAIEALKQDQSVMDVFGKSVCERFIRYKENEEAKLGEMPLHERRALIMSLF